MVVNGDGSISWPWQLEKEDSKWGSGRQVTDKYSSGRLME